MGLKNIVNIKALDRSIANPENPELFKIYLNTIYKYKPLSREEEVSLFERLQICGEDEKLEIKEKICKHNLLFVLSVAKIYATHTNKSIVRLEDLVSEGNMGLYIAIDKFDYKTGNKFISYAVWHIRQQILKCIGDNIKNIRIPSNRQDLNKWVNKKQSQLEQEFGRPIHLTEMFEVAISEGKIATSLELEEFIHIIHASSFETSLSSPIQGSNNSPSDFLLVDMLESSEKPPSHNVNSKELTKNIHVMLDRLSPVVRECILDYYGIDGRECLTLKQIAAKREVTSEGVRQWIAKGLRMLKHRNRRSREYFLNLIEEVNQ